MGSSELAKRWQAKPGDIVSFKYRGFLLSSGLPKLPSIYRLRSDLTWQNVIDNWKEKKPSYTGSSLSVSLSLSLSRSLAITHNTPHSCTHTHAHNTALPLRQSTIKTRPKGYWTSVSNRKAAFTAFAKEMGFDPLDKDAWNNISTMQFGKKMVLPLVISFYSNTSPLHIRVGLYCINLKAALKQLYNQPFLALISNQQVLLLLLGKDS